MKQCTRPACNIKVRARGLCGYHYTVWARENRDVIAKYEKHGSRNTPEYRVWAKMKARCTLPSNISWDRYGGRGIKVCIEWSTSFSTFYKDMGPRPSPQHSIERVNNDGDYEPGNCRWATAVEQALNRRRRSDNKSGITGVWYSAAKKGWLAQTTVNRVKRTYGPYATRREAEEVRSRIHGERLATFHPDAA